MVGLVPGWVILLPITIGILAVGLGMRVPVAVRGDHDVVPYFFAAVQLGISFVVSLGLWLAYFGDMLLKS